MKRTASCEGMPNSVSAIVSALDGPVALFCDFDGTLVDIASSPEAVIVPLGLIPKLQRLENILDGALAIVTGRTISDLDSFFDGIQFSVFGNHGAERRVGGVLRMPAKDVTEKASAIASSTARALGDDPRILIETKSAGVAIHFRAAPERGEEAHKALEAAIAEHDEFSMIEGKKVVEARISGVDKGKAVDALMMSAPFSKRIPIFVGDDVTDEDGFRAVQSHGGLGVKVGPGETQADFVLADVNEVYQLLDALGSAPAHAKFTKDEASAAEGTYK